MVTNGHDDPVCIIETVDVQTIPFDEVGETFAYEGGEGDRSLANWRRMYWKYIVHECTRIGRATSEKAPLVMERFRVVYKEPLRQKDRNADPDDGQSYAQRDTGNQEDEIEDAKRKR